MSWIGPAAKKAVKYGPQAKIAWDKAGRPAAEIAAKKAQTQLQRRKAFAKAATVVEGSVIRLIHAGEPVHVVLAHGEPVEAYPPVDVELPVLLKDADLTAAVTSEDHEARRVKARVARARSRGRGRGRLTSSDEATGD
ncbi:hypothetical protein [Aeromicrobium fastidiosum]|uniref:Uncharacterized protein n=1 Tax=Aeromicrobium fastidiosum TaxID=52699 RepID=A0A641API9_9ACTN|nr:hypothetical protein [Aeromicrobium fastidiosum]KAA1380000.1 hypothetical protein ESP62_001995 [Aeromicrobium fastidiosum]MBP2389522.1 antitoxin (DNA-binding transcriptional repressor) of toxin-antitoxin stability system [Aeromicrobium fastidiosum]